MPQSPTNNNQTSPQGAINVATDALGAKPLASTPPPSTPPAGPPPPFPQTPPPLESSPPPPLSPTAGPRPDKFPQPPPTAQPRPPEKSKSTKIQKSPFRFMIPLLLFIVIGGLIYAGIKFLPQFISTKTRSLTLTYWGLWEPSENLQTVFQEFESQNPGVKVNYVQQSPKDYRERLQAAIDRGEGPDIFRFHNTWVPLLKNNLANLPSSVLTNTEFESTFYPVAAKDLRLGDSYVGIPLMFDGLALYYNKNILSAAGKTPPTTWENLRQIAAELTLRDDQEKIIRSGVALGTTANVDHWPDILGLMILQNGTTPARPTDQLAQDALAFYTLFSRTDKIWDETLPSSIQAFTLEKAAMIFAPSWRAFDIKSKNPSLDFATVPVPQLPKTNLTWASYWAEGVSSATTKDKQAYGWKLLKFLSQSDQQKALYTAASQTRLFGEPYSRKELASQLTNDPVVAAYLTSAPTAQSWYLASATHDNGVNDRIIKYYEDAINAINQGENLEDVTTTAEQGITQVLSQFGVPSR